MDINASKKPSRLLDALDSSFLPSVVANSHVSPLERPLIGYPLQTPQSSNADASGSSPKKRAALNIARGVQGSQSMPTAASSATHFLSGALGGRTPQMPSSSLGGFHLNYDHETPIRTIDVGGDDQQQRMAEFVTKSIDNLSHGLTVRDAMKNLGLRDNKDLLPGLEVRLLPHQAIGVSWMLAQEKSHNKGGILADDMGLGKTVQMIATMAMNLPDLEAECRTTLIIVPAALLQQWKDEIDTKSNGIFSVHVHHGRDKLKKLSEMESKDIIITTYQTLNMDFGVPKDVESHEEQEWLAQHGGILARMRYYRAIADEAQFIRNRSTRSSTSLAHVRAKYRWMLTGTPVTNTLADIYGLLRFGRFRPWNDWNDFNEYVAKVQIEDAPLAGQRAQAILKPILLRRTKNSMLEGEPILKLPPKEIKLVKLEFSLEERDLYDSFEKRTKIRLNKFIRERTLVKNHAVVLVMILRLRQLCCHPNLILALTDGFEDPTLLVGSDGDKELGRALKTMGSPWVAEIKKRFLARARATELLDFSDETDEPEATCPVCKDLYMNDSGRVLACGHEICFDCLLDLRNSPIAHDGIFGYGNEKQNQEVEKEYENAVAKGFRPCPTCKKMTHLQPPKVFKSTAFEPSDEELTNHARSKRRGKRGLAKRNLSDEEDEDGDVRMGSSPLEKSFEDRGLDDSDDDLPDIAHIFHERPNKRQKKSSRKVAPADDDELIDLTMHDISVNLPSCSSVPKSDMSNDSDVEFLDTPVSPTKTPQNSPQVNGRSRNATSESPRSQQKYQHKANSGVKGKYKEHNGARDGPSDAVIATWRKGDDDLEPSAKMVALVELLQKWEASGDKTICYSQWTSMLNLIEILFSRHGIRSLRFDGKMDRAARDSTLATFKKAGGPKVILISTKSGSVGLNLVSANRIINMDLSWNYAAESQAYDRAHRIGQDKTVYVKRLVVRNTIEERMLQLQDVKVGLAEAALGEGTGAKLHKLSIKDIKHLFGMTTKTDDERSAT